MPYVVERMSPIMHQIGLDEMLFGDPVVSKLFIRNETNTRTRFFKEVPEEIAGAYDKFVLVAILKYFNLVNKNVIDADRHKQYRTYQIPKRTGGFRTICEPCPELKEAQRQLVSLFKNNFGALYHTSAFAYIDGRSSLEANKRHQQNESYWFADYDFHDFFGSTTMPFVLKMLSQIFPFNLVLETDDGRKEMTRALSICFLDNGLPQGAVTSPMLTNIMMIPVDHYFCRKLHLVKPDGKPTDDGVRYVYTRYADDIRISSRMRFDHVALEKEMKEFLEKIGAPFTFNSKKTSFGNRSGSNFWLGLCLNAENNITVGWRAQDELRHDLNQWLYDRMCGIQWTYKQLTHLYGVLKYFEHIDADWAHRCICKYEAKYGVDLERTIQYDIKHAKA